MPPSSNKTVHHLDGTLSHTPLATIRAIKNIRQPTRVLVLGKSGIGKSSLVNGILNAGENRPLGDNVPSISHFEPGTSNIDNSFSPNQNKFLKFHDSEGYEAGTVDKFDILRRFVKERSGSNVPFEERVHLVWHCVELPMPQGRLSCAGDRRIIELCAEAKVPIIVIFTKFDRRVKFARAAIQGKGTKTFTREELEKAKKDGIAQAKVAFELCCSKLRGALQKADLHCIYTSLQPGDEHTLEALITNTIEICTKARR